MTIQTHVYGASPEKFFVNSFLVETDVGVVVIDTQFLVSTARDLRAKLDAIGKPLAAVIVTHPHPDHFGGLPVLLSGLKAVPVYATAATIAGIKATRAEKRAAWTPVYGDDYPKEDGLPDHEIGPDATITLAGTTFRVIDVGPGESSDNTIIHIPDTDALIASDLIYNQCHPWLAEQRSGAWLKQLDRVEKQFSDVATVYPGHGPPGGRELFAAQRSYIEGFRKTVAARAVRGKLDTGVLSEIDTETRAGRAQWPLASLIPINATAIAEE